MIKINEIKETTCILIDPQGVVVGEIASQLQLDDVRIQIKKQCVSEYTIKWKDQLINISKDGSFDIWPVGFFDIMDTQLNELLDCK